MTTMAGPRMTLFDGALSQRGYALNRFAKSLTTPAGRAAFLADQHATMTALGLTDDEQNLVQKQDWGALLERGCSIYLIAKIAIVYGGSLNHVGAQMRGETLDEFLGAVQRDRAARRHGDA